MTSLPENPKGLKRLKKELRDYEKEPIEGVEILPHEQNFLVWFVNIEGPKGSPNEGTTFKLRMDMTNAYPFNAPEVAMETPIIGTKDGKFSDSQDTLKKDWKPVQNTRFVINMVKNLIDGARFRADPAQPSQHT